MNAKPSKAATDLRMSAVEFDRIMGKALQVKPQDAKSSKKEKPKAANKKSHKSK